MLRESRGDWLDTIASISLSHAWMVTSQCSTSDSNVGLAEECLNETKTTNLAS